MKYAIKYRTKGIRTKTLAQLPCWVWVVRGKYGPTSERVKEGKLPADLQVFDTPINAIAFIEGWSGHPWDSLKGDAYEIVEVQPNMVIAQQGWKLKE